VGFSSWHFCCRHRLQIAFSKVAAVAQRLQVVERGFPALAPGDNVIDMQRNACGRRWASAALDAAEIITAKDVKPKAY
jgi:hypothetical protein